MNKTALFLVDELSLDPLSVREMIKAWNMVGIDYRSAPKHNAMGNWANIAAIVTVGTHKTEHILSEPYRNLGRLETFVGQAFIISEYPVPIYPIYSPYNCKTSEGATDFYRSVSNFWSALNNPVRLYSTFEPKRELDLMGRKAVDTEGTPDKPWSVQLYPDHTQFYKLPDRAPIGNTPLIAHSALHDYLVLRRMGYDPRIVDDTLIMAYHLGLPMGLKELAVRELGVVMTPYMDIIRNVFEAKLREFFTVIVNTKEFQVSEGRKHSVAKRVNTLLKKLSPATVEEVWTEWNTDAREDVRKAVSAVFPLMTMPTLEDIDIDTATEYAIKDSKATYCLAQKLEKKITALGITEAYRTNIDLIPMVSSMQTNGLPLDIDETRKLAEHIASEKNQALADLQAKLGPDFNPNSSHDTLKALQDSGAELHKKTPGGDLSTGKTILKGLAADNEIAAKVLKFRELAKLESTYVPALVDNYNNGYIYPTWRMANTDTGRMSCSNPNIMAFPERTEIGKRFKRCFIAPEGWIFANADLDQIEMRVMAHLSGDETMINAINTGLDLHTATASYMFNVPYDQVDKKKQRFPAKTINFLMIFEGGAQKLTEQLAAEGTHMTKDEAQVLLNKWFDIYPGVKEYQRIQHLEAEIKGYVQDMWGNIRYVNGANAVNKMVALECQRQAGNFPVQSGAQILLKRAMVRIWAHMQQAPWYGNVRIVAQIHDELVFLIRKGYEHFMADVVSKELKGDEPKFKVRLSSSHGFGNSWGDLK